MTEEFADGTRSCRQGERRTSNRRYDIAVRAWFAWQLPDGARQEGGGTTQNISSRGAWIATPVPPHLGTAVEVTVDVPPLKQGMEISGRLRGRGTVVRVLPGEGFAAEAAFQLERVGAFSGRIRRTEVVGAEEERQDTRSPPAGAVNGRASDRVSGSNNSDGG